MLNRQFQKLKVFSLTLLEETQPERRYKAVAKFLANIEGSVLARVASVVIYE